VLRQAPDRPRLSSPKRCFLSPHTWMQIQGLTRSPKRSRKTARLLACRRSMCRTSGRTLIAQRSNTAATARRRPRGNDIMRATVRERGPRGGHPWARGRPLGSHRLRGARTAAARREASNHPRHGRRRADAGKASARGSESLLADGRSREADNVSNRKQFDIRPCLERRRCPAALPHNPYKCYRHFQVSSNSTTRGGCDHRFPWRRGTDL
jgi:hypothetical protein